ncbi:MAG: diglucosylglycerate octanoyltransferase [Mycobacteriaceae bacterium]
MMCSEIAKEKPILIVIADSLAYYGPKGGLPADHPKIWPNLVAQELNWDVELIARVGWTSRDLWWALTQDPRIWAAVPKAGAVIFAVGGMDSLPSPLPTALRETIRYIRPPRLRRMVREAYSWLQPRLAPLGWPVALPAKLTAEYLESSRAALEYMRPELPVIATLPPVHISEAYAKVHSGRPATEAAIAGWAAQRQLPVVDVAAAVSENIFSGQGNPDGIHWGFPAHEAVAKVMIEVLRGIVVGAGEVNSDVERG